jgi:hypothetical protein
MEVGRSKIGECVTCGQAVLSFLIQTTTTTTNDINSIPFYISHN